MSPRHRRKSHPARNPRGRVPPGGGEADTATTGRTSRVGPSSAHEDFWNALDERIAAKVAEFTPTLGTVVGMDGGAVKVQMDEEDDLSAAEIAQRVGFSKHLGARYLEGQRVLVSKTRSGRAVVAPIGDIGGQDDYVVDDADMFDNAISNRHIQVNSITRDEVAAGSIANHHIDRQDRLRGDAIQTGTLDKTHLNQPFQTELTNTQQAANQAETKADTAQTQAGNAKTAADNAKNRADSAWTKADNAAGSAQTAKNIADNVKVIADRHTTQIKELQTRVNKLAQQGNN